MLTLATICTIVAALNGIVLLGSVLPASAYLSSSFEREIGADRVLVFSVTSIKNSTVYYATCARDEEYLIQECLLHRVQANFSGGSPKEDECRIVTRRYPDIYDNDVIRIHPFGTDRAIVRWLEYKSGWPDLRYTIVDFSNCNVKTTEISEDFNRLVMDRELYPGYWHISGVLRKGEDDFEAVSIDAENVYRSSIDAEGVASKVDTLFTYRNNGLIEPFLARLTMDEGYVFIQIFPTNLNKRFKFDSLVGTLIVAHIRPNGERKNLTRIENVHWPSVSLDNGLIGICARRNETSMECTQFELDDKEINWFSASIIQAKYGQKRVIYNLPRGEGFLTFIEIQRYFWKSPDKYLVKIGLDGKTKQFVDPDLNCLPKDEEKGYIDIFEDNQGNYCMSIACVKNFPEDSYPIRKESAYVKLYSKCFQPEDFKNISK
ncbi:hypothetical protein TKK_0006925 [Trichogramma kaykai]|uniref:Uncharacterized protein n=1 Tax=Trichogramma kaykai TaxID=54128 RepID=A0ABD2XAZ8_9HYME